MFPRPFAIAAACCTALSSLASAGTPEPCAVEELAKIFPFPVAAGDMTGSSMDAHEDWLIMGQPARRIPGTTEFPGGAIISKIEAGRAAYSQLLLPVFPNLERFGESVSIDEDTAVIGAPETLHPDGFFDSGAVFIYTRAGNIWHLSQFIRLDEWQANARFGYSVKVSGDLLFVGAPYHSEYTNEAGAVYIYRNIAGVWTFEHKIIPSSPPTRGHMGWSLDYHNGTLVIGAPEEDSRNGAIYEAHIEKGEWVVSRISHNSEIGSHRSQVGYDVAVYDDLIVAGAPFYPRNQFSSAGALTWWTRDAKTNQWTEHPRVHAQVATAGQAIATSVDLDQNNLVVGASFSNIFARDSGEAFFYRYFPEDGLVETAALIPSDPAGDDFFGSAVAIANARIFVSARNGDDEGTNSGVIYTYASTDDCNNDSVPDLCDSGSELFEDCNINGTDDLCEIANGTAMDVNGNSIPDECETDCDNNNIPDAYEILLDPSLDCNDDAILDECQLDLNQNLTPDVCEIQIDPELDCNQNDVLDEYEPLYAHQTPQFSPLTPSAIFSFKYTPPGPLVDDIVLTITAAGDLGSSNETISVYVAGQFVRSVFMNSNCNEVSKIILIPKDLVNDALASVPTVIFRFQLSSNVSGCAASFIQATIESTEFRDCNANLIPDSCEILLGDATDCNENNILDACEIIQGETDCDGNKIPDSCETSFVSEQSPVYDSLYYPETYSIDIEDLPRAGTDVQFTIQASGDLGALTEYLEILVNAQPVARAFEIDGHECSVLPIEATTTIPAHVFNSAAEGPLTRIEIAPSFLVTGEQCPSQSLEFAFEYQAVTPADCNATARVDICDIILGFSADENNNYIPDECELLPCDADADASGSVDVSDISFVLFRLGDSGTPGSQNTPGDVVPDGSVDVNDITAVLFRLGTTCP